MERGALAGTHLSGKRPASPLRGPTEGQPCKRAKDAVDNASVQQQPQPIGAAVRAKRAYDDEHAQERPLSKGAGGGSAATGSGDTHHVLQASDLENSLTRLTAALRWRSPVKPHKLPRLHGPDHLPGRPTAVRGIVDVGADGDNDEEQFHGGGGRAGADAAGCRQQPQEKQQQQRHQEDQGPCRQDAGRGTSGGEGVGGGGKPCGSGGDSRPPVAVPQQQQQQHEWGRLFSALSLGGSGAGRSSQRTDPVWAAASSNRTAGGATARRVAMPGPEQLKATGSPAQAAGGCQTANSPCGMQTSPGKYHQQRIAESTTATAGACSGAAAASENTNGVVMDAEESKAAAAETTALGRSCVVGTAVGSALCTRPERSQSTVVEGVACVAVMDASPMKQVVEGAVKAPERRATRSGSSGGFLAQEYSRMLASAARDACS